MIECFTIGLFEIGDRVGPRFELRRDRFPAFRSKQSPGHGQHRSRSMLLDH
jgi:hypothetical protein